MGGEAILLTETVEHLWTSCQDALREQLSDAVWQTWFGEISASAGADAIANQLVLTLPNTLVRDHFERRFLPLVTQIVRETAPVPYDIVLQVQAPVGDDAAPVPTEVRSDWGAASGTPISVSAQPVDTVSLYPTNPGSVAAPRYTFDAFVIGSSNRFAHAAALAVAERPAQKYNPLFIYGGPGLGKTHLLLAIREYVRENYPQYRVRYASAETFTNEFIDSLRSNTANNFKRNYRECDVLLIDDIQFMEGKESTKEEFFHTFNILHEASHQIVITSDRSPKSLEDLEDRLRSRFEMGLATNVQPPELETRLAILRKKAERDPIGVDPAVLEFIATNITDNIRKLEGALTRVSAFTSIHNETVNEEVARSLLADLLDTDQPQIITPRLILEVTAKHTGFTTEELCGTSRRRPLTTARQIAMYLFRELTDFSYPAIAREFGGRDHTTVIYAVEKIGKLMRERRSIYNQVTELGRIIRKGG